MKLPLLAALAGLVLMTGAAQAQYQTKHQVGVYINPVVSRISNPADTGVFAFLGPNKSSAIFAGFDMGGYDDFMHSPSSDVGVDLRGNFLRSSGSFIGSFLVGPRVVFKPSSKMKPYIEGLVGVGRSHPPHNPRGLSAFQYEVLGGVDYSFSSHVDFRMFEVGYSGAQTIGSGVINSGKINTSQMLNVSTGLVFRFK